MSNLVPIEIVTKTNCDELKELIIKYNYLSEELTKTAEKLAEFNIQIETKIIKVPSCEM